MNLNKRQLVKVILAIVISAALAIISVLLAIYLGQTVLNWFATLAPRTRTYLTILMLLVAAVAVAFVFWRMRKVRKQ